MEKFLQEMKHRAGLSEGPSDEYGDSDEPQYVIEHHVSSSRPFEEVSEHWMTGEAVQALLEKSPLAEGQYIVIRPMGPDGR